MKSGNLFTVPKWLFAIALIGCLMVGCNSSSQPIVTPPSTVDDIPQSTIAERLQAVLEQAVADGLPGAALAVRGDDFRFDGVAGVEDIATAVPLSVNHRFYLASVGKTYTAVAMLKLASDGLLNIDDPITSWVPAAITDQIPTSDRISIRSLLNHTSGIFDFRNDGNEGKEWDDVFIVDPTIQWANTDVLPYFLDKPLHFAPGTDYRYSNSNYVLAALIAEAASGMPIEDVIRHYIIEPLGLQDTVHGNEAQGLPHFAHGYLNADGDIIDTYPWYSHYGVSDGGIQSSAADLADFVRQILSGDTILDNDMRAYLLTPSGVGNPPSIYGLGIEIIAEANTNNIIYQHAGKNEGYQAIFGHITSADKALTLSLCVNASLGDYDSLHEQLISAVQEVLSDAKLIPEAVS